MARPTRQRPSLLLLHGWLWMSVLLSIGWWQPQHQCFAHRLTLQPVTAGKQNGALVGGVAVDTGMFPFAVKIMKNGRVICGGSILSARWILTAAHCMIDAKLASAVPPVISFLEAERLSVTIGQASDDPRSFAIDRLVPHPKFELLKTGAVNDIGLVHLAEDLPLRSNVELAVETPDDQLLMPVNLWVRAPHTALAGPFVAVGWGRTDQRTAMSASLRAVSLWPSRAEQCSNAIGTAVDPTVSGDVDQICAGLGTGQDTCFGDSGGPLVVRARVRLPRGQTPPKQQSGKAGPAPMGTRWVLVGVTSYGVNVENGPPDCGTEGMVGVYTRPERFLDFIRATMGPDADALTVTVEGVVSMTMEAAPDSPTAKARGGMRHSDSAAASVRTTGMLLLLSMCSVVVLMWSGAVV